MSTNPKFINNLKVLETARFGGTVTFEEGVSFDTLMADEIKTPLITYTDDITVQPAVNKDINLTTSGTGNTIFSGGVIATTNILPDNDGLTRQLGSSSFNWFVTNTRYLTSNTGSLTLSNANFIPDSDNARTCGSGSYNWGNIHTRNISSNDDLSISLNPNFDITLTTSGTGKTIIAGSAELNGKSLVTQTDTTHLTNWTGIWDVGNQIQSGDLRVVATGKQITLHFPSVQSSGVNTTGGFVYNLTVLDSAIRPSTNIYFTHPALDNNTETNVRSIIQSDGVIKIYCNAGGGAGPSGWNPFDVTYLCV